MCAKIAQILRKKYSHFVETLDTAPIFGMITKLYKKKASFPIFQLSPLTCLKSYIKVTNHINYIYVICKKLDLFSIIIDTYIIQGVPINSVEFDIVFVMS